MRASLEDDLIAQAWTAVSDDGVAPPPDLRIVGTTGDLPSRFPVEAAALACVAAALSSAGALSRQRGSGAEPIVVDRRHVAAAVRSERFFRRGGRPAPTGFAPLSRFWRVADGWVRTHANYPWHRAALLAALGVDDDEHAVHEAMAGSPAVEIEDRVFAAGGIAAAVRSLETWRAHRQGRAVAGEPLVARRQVDGAPPRARPAGGRPASGLRVVDLTRVIAGPVCTRYLGALDADVVRLDPPHHPDMPAGSPADTLLGKRSALVDLGSPAGRAACDELLERADVVVIGYRPGALDRFGLAADALAERHPGLVIVSLDAWGHTGPWAGRRGFDSIVQAPSGIADGESIDGAEPGALPCQLLDHGTGYLAAAAVLDGVRRQTEQGGTHIRRLSLARTAWWLTSTPPSPEPRRGAIAPPPQPPPWSQDLPSKDGSVNAVAPPGRIGERPLRWPKPATGYGDDQPTWTDST